MPRALGTSRHGATHLLSLIPVLATAMLAAATLSLCGRTGTTSPRDPLGAGAAAPNFALVDVRGAMHALGELKGQVVLLSFLELQAPAALPRAQPSRAQITFLKSMHTQYAPKGLVVLLVDGSRLRPEAGPDRAALYNATFNWNLGDLPVISDDQPESLVSRYGVTGLPTTFLIGRDGRIVERWEGVASAPQLARRLQELVGVPAVPK